MKQSLIGGVWSISFRQALSRRRRGTPPPTIVSNCKIVTKFKISLIGAVAIASVVSSLVIQQRTNVKLREKEDVLRQQDSHLAELDAERQRLSNLVVQATNAPTNDQMIELQKLRSRAEA